jgi:uroporphyrinogen-III decarboxylase
MIIHLMTLNDAVVIFDSMEGSLDQFVFVSFVLSYQYDTNKKRVKSK